MTQCFHVHRAQNVIGGNYFFTSVTPRPFFEFPYPVAIYVIAKPLWRLVPDHVLLLRGLSIAVDAVTAFLLFLTVQRLWGARNLALLATTIYLLVPVGMQTLVTANLTNLFGQAVFSPLSSSPFCCRARAMPP